jgi:hypothetical protein
MPQPFCGAGTREAAPVSTMHDVQSESSGLRFPKENGKKHGRPESHLRINL